MKVKAPFHIAESYKGIFELFSYRQKFTWFRYEWDYFFCMTLRRNDAMTDHQIELARHSLGFPNKMRTSYRNHFVAGEGHSDYAEWLQMVATGNAMRRKGNELSGGDDVFWLTERGARSALRTGEKLSEEDWPSSVTCGAVTSKQTVEWAD